VEGNPGLLRRVSFRPAQNPARRREGPGFYLQVMSKTAALLLLAALVPAAGLASLTETQRAKAESLPAVTVPTPAEFFGAIDKVSRPDWAAFYRDPGPTSFPTRPQTAFNLGALVADGYIAVEAQDGQQVKNTGKDIVALARALGVGENVLARGKSISDFADKNDWFALREELEATTNEVRRAMADQRDEALASLILAGTWVRSLQAGGRAAELSGEPSAASLLGQQELIAYLHGQLLELPEKVRTGPVVARVGDAFLAVGELMTVDGGGVPGLERAGAIQAACAELMTQLGSK